MTGLSASLEDYLQAVYRIQTAKQAARPTDIAVAVGVNNSSVTGALRTLSERGLVNYAPYDIITLTPKGLGVAREIARRHDVLHRFFTRVLKAEADEAEATACRVEHVISADILDRLVRFVEFLELCPRAGEDWIREFWERCGSGNTYESCDACLDAWERKSGRTGVRVDPESVELAEMAVGMRGKIDEIDLPEAGLRRLAGRGVRTEAVVRIVAADEGGMEVEVGGYRLRMRRVDAEKIRARPFSTPRR
jgi:DtxR family transcriptional regulator, Mn-dependent transcriptional regulator